MTIVLVYVVVMTLAIALPLTLAGSSPPSPPVVPSETGTVEIPVRFAETTGPVSVNYVDTYAEPPQVTVTSETGLDVVITNETITGFDAYAIGASEPSLTVVGDTLTAGIGAVSGAAGTVATIVAAGIQSVWVRGRSALGVWGAGELLDNYYQLGSIVPVRNAPEPTFMVGAHEIFDSQLDTHLLRFNGTAFTTANLGGAGSPADEIVAAGYMNSTQMVFLSVRLVPFPGYPAFALGTYIFTTSAPVSNLQLQFGSAPSNVNAVIGSTYSLMTYNLVGFLQGVLAVTADFGTATFDVNDNNYFLDLPPGTIEIGPIAIDPVSGQIYMVVRRTTVWSLVRFAAPTTITSALVQEGFVDLLQTPSPPPNSLSVVDGAGIIAVEDVGFLWTQGLERTGEWLYFPTGTARFMVNGKDAVYSSIDTIQTYVDLEPSGTQAFDWTTA